MEHQLTCCIFKNDEQKFIKIDEIKTETLNDIKIIIS